MDLDKLPFSEELVGKPIFSDWKRIGISSHHGIDLPLSAIRSKNSCGIGEFFDLLPLIDWCKEIGLDVIQLLPLNDSGRDPSPYNNLSSCAMSLIYLSLHALPYVEEHSDLQKKLSEIQQFNTTEKIAFSQVKMHKKRWLRIYFEKVGATLVKEEGFLEFLKKNAWLIPYGLFKALKDQLEQNNWINWPEELKHPDKKKYEELVNANWKEISFYIVIQYLCFLQLKKVREYANGQKIFLKGDIPILISPDSADVWHAPQFFELNLAAGAPPDKYNKEGQYWGFPIFRWDILKKDHYQWWKERLGYASHFFDLYRVDHVVGFFRIWAIPLNRPSKEGAFIPQDKNLWIPHGKELLEMMVASARMLPIAEDLGTVPTEVRDCLQTLGICGTKVMRWERLWEKDQSFIPLKDYPALSLTCLSTHDSETLSLWWRDAPEESKAFADFKGWTYTPTLSFEQRREILWDSHHTPSLFHINLLQEYLALFPELIWPKPEDERINVPGQVLSTNWVYRFRPSLEEITSHQELKKTMQFILKNPTPR